MQHSNPVTVRALTPGAVGGVRAGVLGRSTRTATAGNHPDGREGEAPSRGFGSSGRDATGDGWT